MRFQHHVDSVLGDREETWGSKGQWPKLNIS